MLKKSLSIFIVLLVTFACGLYAQIIHKGDKFWDGQVLYTAQSEDTEFNFLAGVDGDGGHRFIILQSTKKAGEYILTKGADDDQPPYGCLFGSRVQYIRQDGMNFLAFYPEEHTIGQTAVLTPDDLKNCIAQQKFAEDEMDPMEMCSNWLMNQKFLAQVHPEVLQGMLNKLMDKKKKTIIEGINQDLIAFFLASGMVDCDHEPEEGAPLFEESEEVQMEEITITDERDFIACLKSNRIIHIPDGTVLNLSNVLNDREFFAYEGRLWTDDYYAQRNGGEELIVSCERFDGRQLELVNVNNLKIIGGKDCYIIVEPRYANVLNFYRCTGITLENLTIGHTEEGYCEGGVIYAEQCELLNINKCDLYGCGTYGIEATATRSIIMTNSQIRDCSYGIMQLNDTHYCSFIDCDFIRCREFELIGIRSNCDNTRFVNCRFAQNKGSLFSIHSKIKMENCEVHHAKAYSIGNVNEGYIEFVDDNTRWLRDDAAITPRADIGPDLSK